VRIASRRALAACLAAVCLLAGGAARAADEAGAAPVEPGAAPFDLTQWLDGQFEPMWKEAGVDVPVVDDATFARRLYLDLVGRIPSVAELRDFLDDTASEKRARLVERLLVDEHDASRTPPDYAAQMARVWRRIMLPPGGQTAGMAAQFEPWLTERFRSNAPYDELARAVLTARGESSAGVAAFYQGAGGNPEGYASAVSRVFLGVRIGCAQCHDHPFADWKQDDFWGMAAFFAGVNGGADGPLGGRGGALDEVRQTTLTYEGQEYSAKYLWGETAEVPEGRLPRDVLAQWMTAADNPNFAATVVNRLWQHLCGRGLVPEVDDLDRAAPDEREQFLDEMALRFEEAGYDLRWLIRSIVKSRAYQAPSGGEQTLAEGRRPLKTLAPEQVFDSLEQALLLPVTRSNAESARHNGQRVQMVSRLDESLGDTPEDYGAGIPQVLMLMNGKVM
jgi:hypothetical protein